MKKNQRPGYLAGFHGLVSRSTRLEQARRARSGLGSFGSFGKGMVMLPPAPPPGTPAEGIIDASTGQTYIQDTRCPPGQKMVQTTEPCEGDDCDPGEMETSEECDNDPNYKLAPVVAPAPAPEPQPQPQQQQQAPAQPSAPADTGPTSSQEAELLKLAQEDAAAEAIVTRAPVLSPPSAYTGGSPPSYALPLARAPKAPDDQQRLMELVSQYKTAKPTTRPAPRPIMRAASPRAPAASAVPDVFGWLKTSLFGSTDGLGSWSDNKALKYGVPVIGLLAVGYFVMRKK